MIHKVNFTKEHYDIMCQRVLEMLLKGEVVYNGFNSPINIVELLHATTLKSLNQIGVLITKKIRAMEENDSWLNTPSNQEKLAILKRHKETIHLIIGYRMYNEYVDACKARAKEINDNLKALKDSQRTPEDRIKELEDELNSISSVNNY